MTEKRAGKRSRTFITARLLFGEGALSADCDIRNLSNEGAKLLVDEEIPVPQDFTLEIPSKNRIHKAHVVWRHGDGVGVAFEQEKPVDDDLDPKARIRRLEQENASLRRQLRLLRAELAMRTEMSEGAI
ncbi:MAG: PilZ domain-containing protein [Rhizobiales bacterium]|nr:PilZ domain-containing protein [Hyphomicrobiales bacterium]